MFERIWLKETKNSDTNTVITYNLHNMLQNGNILPSDFCLELTTPGPKNTVSNSYLKMNIPLFHEDMKKFETFSDKISENQGALLSNLNDHFPRGINAKLKIEFNQRTTDFLPLLEEIVSFIKIKNDINSHIICNGFEEGQVYNVVKTSEKKEGELVAQEITITQDISRHMQQYHKTPNTTPTQEENNLGSASTPKMFKPAPTSEQSQSVQNLSATQNTLGAN